ncbi:hypothetical protein [Adlercreutzia sp. ZJ473]|nr:hypothetical protein [Adlercreutzia sp. ZJ473]
MRAFFNSPTRRCLSCSAEYRKEEPACPYCGAKAPAPAGVASDAPESKG